MSANNSEVRYLSDIVPFLNLKAEWQSIVITGLAVDSRNIEVGNCFIAYPGDHADGRDFLLAAEKSGAACAIVESEGYSTESTSTLPIIEVPELRGRLGQIASLFYRSPSSQLQLCAVTGTNGKTSVSQLIANSLAVLGHRCGIIGTLGSGFPGALTEVFNTTPGVVENNRLLRKMLDEGAEYAVMEASSHGLVQGRLDDLKVDFGVITNISRDHLDYHGTMEEYREAKALLAMNTNLKLLVLNADDPLVISMKSLAPAAARVVSYSLGADTTADVRAVKVEFLHSGLNLSLVAGSEHGTIQSALVGDFNASNLLAAATALLVMGFSLERLCAALSSVGPVAGRMQKVSANSSAPLVIIDFAHTPDALEKALLAARRHCTGTLWCVFGCGGDRDAGKRPMMAEAVSRFADEMVLTADNPRSEKLNDIFSSMQKGIPTEKAYVVIEDRAQAIEHAVRNAAIEDVILVAGKGHETYQEIKGVKFPYSDLNAAEKALSLRLGSGGGSDHVDFTAGK